MCKLGDFLEENRGLLLTVGLAVVVGSRVLPNLRPIAKSAIKGYLAARQTVLEAAGSVVEEFQAEA